MATVWKRLVFRLKSPFRTGCSVLCNDQYDRRTECAQRTFQNEIIGIDIGASLMNLTEKAVDEYGLQLALMPSSGPTMTAFLQKSVEHNDWIVVTGWTPHWMFSRYDLKFLKTVKVCSVMQNISKPLLLKAFRNSPLRCGFKNFRFTNEQLSELMDIMEEYPLRESREQKFGCKTSRNS